MATEAMEDANVPKSGTTNPKLAPTHGKGEAVLAGWQPLCWKRPAVAWLSGMSDTSQAHIEHRAKADELIRLHLALPVEDAPERLLVAADAPHEFRNADALLLTRGF